jgi:hypothetical protein
MLKWALNECCAEPSRSHLPKTRKEKETGEDMRMLEVAGRHPKRVAAPLLLHSLSLLPSKQPMPRPRINALATSFLERQRFSKWGLAASAVAQRALFRHYDVALVWASGARLVPAAVDCCADEVNAGIGAWCVDPVVLDDVTHFGGCVLLFRRKRLMWMEEVSCRGD